MATKTAILSVKIVSDAKDFSSKMDDSASKLGKFQAKASKLAVPAAAVVAGLGAIAIGAGKMASEAEQNFGAVDAVFKGHADSVKAMAKTSAENLGLSGSDYAKYSALLGSQLKNAGVPLDQLAGQTDKLIGYGADFAAQFGGSVPDAVEALSSALKGEMDPIEKYGISLTQAKIDAEASALGFEKVGGAFDSSAKQAAIMSLVASQGADALGAFGREAGTAAGQQAIATAKWQDASAALGAVLLPIMTQAATILAEVAGFLMENQTAVTIFAAVIGVLAAAIVALNVVLTIMNVIAALNPFVLIAVAVVALITVIVLAATQTTFFQDVWRAVAAFATVAWQAFTTFVSAAWSATVTFFQNAALGMQIIWQAITLAISTAWDGAVNFVKGVAANLASFFVGVVSGIQNTWNAGFNFVRSVVQNVVSAVINILTRIGVSVLNIISNVRSTFSSGFRFAQQVVSNAIVAIATILLRIQQTVQNVINNARNIFSSGFQSMQNFASSMINNVVDGFGRIVNAVSNAIGWVQNLFNLGGMPGWLSSVLGMGGTGFEFTGAFAPTGGEFGMGATGGASFGAMLSGSRSAPVVTNYQITVNGAIDPVSTARQIKSILNSDAQLTGRTEVGTPIW